jgi:hypothetical protein
MEDNSLLSLVENLYSIVEERVVGHGERMVKDCGQTVDRMVKSI